MSKADEVWNPICRAEIEIEIEIKLVESQLLKPLGWKERKKISVCEQVDLFHENVPSEWVDKVFAIAALCKRAYFPNFD